MVVLISVRKASALSKANAPSKANALNKHSVPSKVNVLNKHSVRNKASVLRDNAHPKVSASSLPVVK